MGIGGYWSVTGCWLLHLSPQGLSPGPDGFIYHHYWFYDGRGPVLAAPLLRMLEDGAPDLPFALDWVNDDWGRGRPQLNGREAFADVCLV